MVLHLTPCEGQALEREALAEEHASNPQPGDYWHECFTPICVVIDLYYGFVIFCKTLKHLDGGWTWDLDSLDAKPVAEFKRWLSYKTIPGYWAHVEPRSHIWAVEVVRERYQHKEVYYGA